MKTKVFYLLGFVVIAVFCSSCASVRPVTDNIIQQVGGSSQLPNFQYYVSRGIALRKVEHEMDGNVIEGQAKIVETVKKDNIDIKKSTPGVVIDYIYSEDLKTHVLRVAFEEDDDKYLQFAHPHNNRSDAWYTLVAQTDQRMVYGDAMYDYSYPESFSILKEIGLKKKGNTYGDVPILLVKLKRSHNVMTTRRTAKGRRIAK